MIPLAWRRLFSALLVTVVILGPLGWYLLARVPDREERSLANDGTTAPAGAH